MRYIRLQKCRDLENRIRGPSRSLEMSPFDSPHMTSCWRSIISMAQSRVVSDIFNVEKYCDLEIGLRGHSRSLKVVPLDILGVVSFLLVFFSNFVPQIHRFWDIRLGSIQWPWNLGLRSLKGIENYTVRSGIHDFLLTFHGNHRSISHRFRDKRRFHSKITNFYHPVYL